MSSKSHRGGGRQRTAKRNHLRNLTGERICVKDENSHFMDFIGLEYSDLGREKGYFLSCQGRRVKIDLRDISTVNDEIAEIVIKDDRVFGRIRNALSYSHDSYERIGGGYRGRTN